MRVRTFATTAFLGFALAARAAANDPSTLSQDELWSLQQRLRDAGCFTATLDGKLTPALEAAVKACPDQEPVLRIETGMHTAPIKRLGVDAACSSAVTASDDKTVRVWSLPDGRLVRTQRLPIGDGDNGKVYAVAMSPDGRWVAAGGWDAFWKSHERHSVYLFDIAAGTSFRRIGTFDDVINHLAFSSDGRRLAVALSGKVGVRAFDVQSGRELMADRDYATDSYGIGFGRDGSLYAVAYDGFLRRYGPDLKRTAKVSTPGGKMPYSVAVDPSGRRVAVGYDDTTAVDVFDAATLRHLVAAETKDVQSGDLSKVGWSADGRRLLAGGRYERKVGDTWQYLVRTWDANGRRIGADRPVATNTIMSLIPCGEAIAFGAQDPSFGLLRADGAAVTLGRSSIPDMRGKKRDAFAVSEDGHRVRFGMSDAGTGMGHAGANPIIFDIASATVVDSPAPVADLRPPLMDGLPVSDWENHLAPKLGGKPIVLERYEISRSLTVRPDRSGFVLGADWGLRAIGADGRERWRKDAPGTVWGVNLARGGELVLAAYGDGTVRWHRWSDGQEAVALFVHKEDKRWVAWTPTGYYMASPGAEDLIGWHVNRGWEQPADFFPASRFRERFNRPDIVRLVLETLDEGEAIKRANTAAKRRAETKPLVAGLPPVIRITGPAAGTRFSRDEVTIGYELRSPSGLKVDRIEVFIDGRLQQERGAILVPADEVKVKVPQQDVELSLIAWSGELASEPARVKLAWAGQPLSGEQLLKPKLYALVIGVSEYNDRAYKLRYAAKDASDFARALEAQRGGMYGDVQIRLLRDGQVSRDSIADGLEWLEQQVTSRDVGVVFLAGHGWTDEKQTYWFLPANATPDRVRVRGVAQDDIRRTLRNLAGKAVLFLDTCHAAQAMQESALRRGSVDIESVVNDFIQAENGVVVFASSKGKQVSLEHDDWQNGAFTKAVVEGLGEGRANLLGTGKITASLLDAFVAERVKQLTRGRQHPVMTKPDTIPDFPLAIVRK